MPHSAVENEHAVVLGAMKLLAQSVLLLGFVAVSAQDIEKRKPCDCTKRGQSEISDSGSSAPALGEVSPTHLGPSTCNICEQRKEMLRLQREKQRQLQKCPFDILGSPSLKGKTSEEIFDEFRELIVPSQNGFFDLMRGIVKTMHVSSESELRWARAKEAKAITEKLRSEGVSDTVKEKGPSMDPSFRWTRQGR